MYNYISKAIIGAVFGAGLVVVLRDHTTSTTDAWVLGVIVTLIGLLLGAALAFADALAEQQKDLVAIIQSQTLPEGLTPEALDKVADHLSLTDEWVSYLMEQFKVQDHTETGTYQAAWDKVKDYYNGDAMQKDLRRWADEMDGVE